MSKRKAATKHSEILFSDETKVHPALKEYFGHCLTKITARLKLLHCSALAHLNIQTYHLGIMKILSLSAPISQIQLGDELGIDKASMVKAIDTLEKLKYVMRIPHPTDRRVKLVQLTTKGKALLKETLKIKETVEGEFFKSLTKKEEESFREIVKKLAVAHSS